MQSPLILPWEGISPRIAADAFIAPNATIIGDVEIGPRASIWFNVVLRADVSFIRIGAGTNIQDGTIVHESSRNDGAHRGTPTLIGRDVLVGHRAVLHACTIEDGAFIGMSSTVLDGAVVEKQAMVAAGAVVGPGKRVPTGELWAGMPARLMRKLTDKELAGFKQGTDDYVAIAALYRQQLSGK